MTTEMERAKAKLLAQIEALDEQRKATQTELDLLETQEDTPVLNMEAFRKLEPSAQMSYSSQVRKGEAKLID
jgi:hypothetical protein